MGSLTSHLQARQLEVSQAPLSEELPVPVLAMLLPMGSATSLVEVAREVKVVSLEAREERVARERVGRAVRAFLEAKAKEKEKEEKEERAGAWMSLSLKSGSLVEFLEHLAEAWLEGLLAMWLDNRMLDRLSVVLQALLLEPPLVRT